MIATHSLPVIRVRVPCANDEDYRRRRAAEFLARGVVVPSDRARAIGSRVRLRIELLDHTFAYDGDATVAKSVQVGGRRGYLLKLGAAAETRPVAGAENARSTPAPGSEVSTSTSTPTSTPTPTSTSTPAAAAPPTPVAAPPQGSDADLARFLFSDLNLADAAAAAAAAATSSHPAPSTPPRLSLAARAPVPRAAAVAPQPPALDARPAGAAAPPRALPQMELVTQEDDRDLPPARRPRRRIPRAAPVAAAVLLCVAAGGGALVLAGPTRADADAVSFAAELRRADDRIRAGRLAGTGNDSALDHLVTARELVPDDPRLARRLKLLADFFGELGDRALARGDVEEAAVHFQATLRADPRSASARQRLREIAERPAASDPGARPTVAARR